MNARKKPSGPIEQLSLPGFTEPVCVCGCALSAHCKKGNGGCMKCLECRVFAPSQLATFARAAATLKPKLIEWPKGKGEK